MKLYNLHNIEVVMEEIGERNGGLVLFRRAVLETKVESRVDAKL